MNNKTLDTFMLERLYNNCGVPIYICKEKQYINENKNCEVIYETDEELLSSITETAYKFDEPIIYMEDIRIFHGVMKLDNNYTIWGPVTLEKLTQVQLASYRYKHHISNKDFSINRSSYGILSNIMAMAYYHYNGIKIKEEDVLIHWKGEINQHKTDKVIKEHFYLDKAEMNRIHNTVEYENKFIAAVENGDVSAMKKLMQVNTIDIDGIGMVAKTAIKQMEYLCVASVTLVSRAALRGGMNPEVVHDLSDYYMQQLEKCKTVEDMAFVTLKMQLDFTEGVSQAKLRNSGNVHVEKCKDYIAKHLRKSFKVNEIAKSLNINRSYLSKIFSEEEGITIQEYIMKERCNYAANMLRYTDYNISIIAEYFCFSTQSHFGKQFKKYYNITPKEYRNQNKYIDSHFNKSN